MAGTTCTWRGTTNGLWATATNWLGSVTPGTDDIVILDEDSVGFVRWPGDSPAAPITFRSFTLNVTGNVVGPNPSIMVNNAGNITVSQTFTVTLYDGILSHNIFSYVDSEAIKLGSGCTGSWTAPALPQGTNWFVSVNVLAGATFSYHQSASVIEETNLATFPFYQVAGTINLYLDDGPLRTDQSGVEPFVAGAGLRMYGSGNWQMLLESAIVTDLDWDVYGELVLTIGTT